MSSICNDEDIQNYYDSLRILEITRPKPEKFNYLELNYLKKLRYKIYFDILSEFQNYIKKKDVDIFKSHLFNEGISYIDLLNVLTKYKNEIRIIDSVLIKNKTYILDVKKLKFRNIIGNYNSIIKYLNEILLDNCYVGDVQHINQNIYKVIISNPLDILFIIYIKIS